MLSPIIEDLSNEVKDVSFAKVNVDEASEIASRYGVQSIPTVYLFKDGQIKNKFVGFIPKEQILKFLKSN
jgi:thioredoxin 1